MGNRAFRSGDFLAVCDRSGMPYHRSEMRREWNGLLVHKRFYEPRHVQDLIRAKSDRQAASPDVRPDKSITTSSTTLGAAAVKNQTSLTVATSASMAQYDNVGITLDDGSVHWTEIASITDGTTIVVDAGLVSGAASGNTVSFYSKGSDFISYSNPVTPSDL